MTSGWPQDSVYENPGNLSPAQKTSLKKFWSILLRLFRTEDGISKEWLESFPSREDAPPETDDLRKALDEFTGSSLRDEFYRFLRHDYADLLPMRFLKARGWQVDVAMRMLLTCLSFRRANIARAMTSEVEGTPEFLAALHRGKSFVPCYDDRGRTVTYIKLAHHARGDCSQDVFERYTLYAMEHAHLLHLPRQDRTVLLVDMTGFYITTLDLGAIKFIINNFEMYYPEELSEGVIHNAPWLFSTAWAAIKPLLRPVTREKITFTSSLAQLAAKIGLAEAQKVVKAKVDYIPRPPEAGEAPFRDQSRDLSSATPACREAFATWNANLDEFEEVTRRWCVEVPATAGAAAAAPEAQRGDVEADRSACAWKLSRSYWLIDEYVRPRSYYDRAGLLPPSADSALNLSSTQSKAGSFKSVKSSRS